MIILQSPARANVVLNTILDSTDAQVQAFNIAVAYATYQGAKTLVDGLEGKLGSRWSTIPKSLVTCFDFGHTEPDGLVYLKDAGFDIHIANLGAGQSVRSPSNRSAFHPKMYIAPRDPGARVVVGSANLSRRALTVNAEAVTSLTVDDDDAWRVPWRDLVGMSIGLTSELLDAYRDYRPRRPGPAVSNEPPIPSAAPAGSLRIFRDAVENGIDPAEFTAFWVDIGSPSGGSGSQLELPRRGQRFFGFQFDDYDDDHHTIGKPKLFSGEREWERPLTWHGNNRMERINLPTAAQGGFEYRDRAVLFERAGSRFEITVAEREDPRATRWRAESAATDTLFRVSRGSGRLCGLI